MTPKQQARVDTLRAVLLEENYGSTAAKYEVKRFEIETRERLVFVSAECGLIGDEGTAAAVFARNRILIMIGPRGALTALGQKGKRHSKPCRNSRAAATAWTL